MERNARCFGVGDPSSEHMGLGLSIMNFWLFLGSVAVSTLAAASTGTFDSKLDEDWKKWKSQHGNQYTKDEERYRRMIWEDNMRYIEQHNIEHSLGKRTSKVGMNKFGALTNEEFNELMNGRFRIDADNMTEFEADESSESESHIDLRTDTVDWRREGVVTPVKNQGQCPASWAFSATGGIEGQWAKRHGILVSLSEQNLIDCTRGRGCSVSSALDAFDLVIQLQGINSAESYPYTGKDRGDCRFQPDKIAAKITDRKWVWGGEAALEQAVREIGPMPVVINASLKSFQHYKGGVYYDKNCNGYLTHEVLVVGFGIEDGMSYWLVKNSWGTDWGEDGYIKIAKDRGNHCGIARVVLYPVV